MGICVEVQGGYVVSTGTPVEDCTAQVLIDATEWAVWSSLQVQTPADVLLLYTWGFGAVLLPWSIGYAVGWAKKTVGLA